MDITRFIFLNHIEIKVKHTCKSIQKTTNLFCALTALPFFSGKRVSDSKNASDFGIEGSSTVSGISTEAVSSEEETTSIAFGSEDVSGVITLTLILE